MRADVTVDDRFVRFGSKSYAINKITSVDVRTEVTPGKKSARIPALTLACGVALLGFAPAFSTGAQGDASATGGVSVMALAVAAFIFWIGWTSKETPAVATHRLFLTTNAGETQAMETNDGNEITEMREAIEDAMARSG